MIPLLPPDLFKTYFSLLKPTENVVSMYQIFTTVDPRINHWLAGLSCMMSKSTSLAERLSERKSDVHVCRTIISTSSQHVAFLCEKPD